MGSFESNVADRFAPGSTVDVVPRLGDSVGSADAVKSAKVGSDGSVKVDGLIDNAPYFLTDKDRDRAVAFVAKTDELRSKGILERAGREATNEQTLAEREGRTQLARKTLASAAPGRETTSNVLTGARSSRAKKLDLSQVQPEIKDQLEERQTVDPNPRPAPNQIDVSGVVQRSDTPFGSATPKEKDEIVPSPSQDDVKGLQRSDTEFGQATPKDRAEEAPAQGQDDVSRGVVQSSDTELGSAEPIAVQSRARGKAAVSKAVEAKRTKDSSGAKVSGEAVKPAAKTGSKKSPADRVKGKSPAKQGKDQ